MKKFNIISFDSLGSTQIEAKILANSKLPTDLITIIVAKAQTAGVGRRGGKWESPTGNLYMTMLLPEMGDPRVSLCVGIAVSIALENSGVSNKIKWPNDVLTSHGKIAGILIEQYRNLDLIGIGVNLAFAPKIADYNTSCAADFGVDINVEEFARDVAENVEEWVEKLRSGKIAEIRAEWLRRADLTKTSNLNGEIVQIIGLDDDLNPVQKS